MNKVFTVTNCKSCHYMFQTLGYLNDTSEFKSLEFMCTFFSFGDESIKCQLEFLFDLNTAFISNCKCKPKLSKDMVSVFSNILDITNLK